MEDIDHIALRKQRLIARCAAQRAAIAGAIGALESPIAVGDRILGVARFFRAHPVLVAAAVAAFAALRRRSLFGLAARGLAAWRMWRSMSVWAHRFGLEFPRSGRQQKTGHAAS